MTRFVVTLLTGYLGTGDKPLTTYYVIDRAICHRVVGRFVQSRTGRPNRSNVYRDARFAARVFARKLNHDFGGQS